MKVTQLKKKRFIKENELKLTQAELFSFFHFMCVATNASELFCMAHLANNKHVHAFVHGGTFLTEINKIM